MALSVNSWCTLALSACLALMARAECGRECAICVYRLSRQQTESDTLTCTLECEGAVDTSKLEICKDIISEEDRKAIDKLKHDEESADPILTKKYGGFMKRYGGFMSKKAAELGMDTPVETADTDVSSKIYGFIKNDKGEGEPKDHQMELLRQFFGVGLGSESDEQDGVLVKRYGGFMRSIQGNRDVGDGRDLHKRYGGFMRRVGRPEWLVNQRSNGYLKRTWEDGSETALPDLQKRYGGFMD